MTHTVLVVDDDPGVLDVIASMLEELVAKLFARIAAPKLSIHWRRTKTFRS